MGTFGKLSMTGRCFLCAVSVLNKWYFVNATFFFLFVFNIFSIYYILVLIYIFLSVFIFSIKFRLNQDDFRLDPLHPEIHHHIKWSSNNRHVAAYASVISLPPPSTLLPPFLLLFKLKLEKWKWSVEFYWYKHTQGEASLIIAHTTRIPTNWSKLRTLAHLFTFQRYMNKTLLFFFWLVNLFTGVLWFCVIGWSSSTGYVKFSFFRNWCASQCLRAL